MELLSWKIEVAVLERKKLKTFNTTALFALHNPKLVKILERCLTKIVKSKELIY